MRLRSVGCKQLEEALDFEARFTEQSKEISMSEVELDAAIRPVEPMHPSLRSLKCLRCRVGLLDSAQNVERATAQEDESPAGPE